MRDNMINYKMKCFFILISITPSLCQNVFDNGLKPDVVFGDHNDRFDVTSLIRKQKRQFRQENILDPQSEEYRRKVRSRSDDEKKEKDSWLDTITTRKDRKKFRKALVKNIERQANEIANTLITRIRSMRRLNGDFAYHDDMNSEGGDLEDYQKNLESFDNIHNLKETVEDTRRLQRIVDKLHGQQTRRNINPENEILLHYALPLDLKIEGFLKAPINDK